MTKKRFEIIKSNLINDGAGFIKDNENEYTFATTFETATLITYAKALNKLNDDNKQLKMGIESLKLLVQNWEALDDEKDEQLDRQNQALKKLKKENLNLLEDLDYYKTKCASLETGYIKAQDEGWRLEKSRMEFANELGRVIDENEQLKSENQEMSNIISAIEKGSCRSIDSFLDDYCTDEILKEFDLE